MLSITRVLCLSTMRCSVRCLTASANAARPSFKSAEAESVCSSRAPARSHCSTERVARPQSAPIEAGEQNGTLCQCPERGSRKPSSSHAPPAMIITSAPRNMKGRTPSTRTSSNPARASPASSIALANRKERVRRSILRAIRFVDVASDLPLRPLSSPYFFKIAKQHLARSAIKSLDVGASSKG